MTPEIKKLIDDVWQHSDDLGKRAAEELRRLTEFNDAYGPHCLLFQEGYVAGHNKAADRWNPMSSAQMAEIERLKQEVATARNLASLSCDLIEDWKRKFAESEAELWAIKSRWTCLDCGASFSAENENQKCKKTPFGECLHD